MAKHGVCHIEWASTDLKRAQAFYGGLFGWKFESWGSEEGYSMFQDGSGVGGALMKVDKVTPGKSPVVYIEVPEIEPYLKKAKELGGKVATPKTLIDPKVGWFAQLTDPDGNSVGLFQGPAK
jgi:predicted enzyme related to lactoylglutathione lyase